MSDIFKALMGSQYQDEKQFSFNLDNFGWTKANITLDKTKRGDRIGESDIGGYTHIGTFVVSAGKEYMIGLRPHNKGGIFYIELKDNSDAIIHGQALIKLVSKDSTRSKVIHIATCNTRLLDPTDYLNRLKAPLLIAGVNIDTVWVTEDSKIELWFKPEVDGSVIDGTKNNIALIDTTVRWL